MQGQIEIETKTLIRFWLVLIGLILAIGLVYSLRNVLIIIGIAIFLAIAISPLVNLVTKRLPKSNRLAGIAVAYVIVVAFLGLVIFVVAPPLVNQTFKFLQTVPELIQGVVNNFSWLTELADKYGLFNQADGLIQPWQSLTSNIGTTIVDGVGSVVSFISTTVLVLVMSFLMLVDAPRIMKKIWSYYNDNKKMSKHQILVKRMYDVVNRYVVGQLFIALIASIVSGLLMSIICLAFGLETNLIIPAIFVTFISSLIPIFGGIICGALLFLALAVNSLPAAVIFLVTFIVYNQIESNIISPKIQSKKIELRPLIVLIAATTGILVLGLVGGIIAMPVAGCIKVLIDYFQTEAHGKPIRKKIS